MLVLPLDREQSWLLPPSLEELITPDHAVRFVAAFVDGLGRADWAELEVAVAGQERGAPGYSPRVLLGVWLYGFMTGRRSTRKLERACREHLPYLWLTGCQQPDHNTLWRFYQTHRQKPRRLVKRTVRTAVRAGLVDLAIQAVDGTKLGAHAAKGRTLERAGLERLLERTDGAVADLEAQNRGGEAPVPPRLPATLQEQRALREQVQAALAQVCAAEAAKAGTKDLKGLKDAKSAKNGKDEKEAKGAKGAKGTTSSRRVNLTDGDARLMKGRQGITAGYNAQAMASPARVAPPGAEAGLGEPSSPSGRVGKQPGGLFITAADVVTDPDDHAQLAPMTVAARENGAGTPLTLADGGYHSGANLAACAALEQPVLMPEAQQPRLETPYHKAAFRYDGASDTYTCPAGQVLRHRGQEQRPGRPVMQVYRGGAAASQACPAFGLCTQDRRQGRALEVGPEEARLQAHRARMATAEAKARYRQRQQLPEPVFGILKEQMGARRLLPRGLEAVRAEWSLLAPAFTPRTLCRAWQARAGWPPAERARLAGVGLS
ncbi:MAG: IS1182 family transposase [Chloroflexi bacterium]|nr:IS1182 family transposase [Chloroflexota bacterium]